MSNILNVLLAADAGCHELGVNPEDFRRMNDVGQNRVIEVGRKALGFDLNFEAPAKPKVRTNKAGRKIDAKGRFVKGDAKAAAPAKPEPKTTAKVVGLTKSQKANRRLAAALRAKSLDVKSNWAEAKSLVKSGKTPKQAAAILAR